MVFKSEAERLRHAIAGVIPGPIWQVYFQSEAFTPFEILLAEEKPAALLATYNVVRYEQETAGQFSKARRCWLLIAYCHANLSVNDLVKIAAHLGISKFNFIGLAIITGNLALFNHLVGPNDQDLLVESHYLLLNTAVVTGQLAILNRILALAPMHKPYMLGEAALSAKDRYRPLQYAAEYGQSAMYDHLALLLPDRDHSKETGHEIYQWAVFNGQLAIINRLLTNKKISRADLQTMLEVKVSENRESGYRASEEDRLAVLERLWKSAGTKAKKILIENFFKMASKAKQSTILKRLNDLDPAKVMQLKTQMLGDEKRISHPAPVQHTLSTLQAFKRAVQEENLPEINRLIANTPREQRRDLVKQDDGVVLAVAANQGNLVILKRLERFKMECGTFETKRDARPFLVAAKSGHVHIMEHVFNEDAVRGYVEHEIIEFAMLYEHATSDMHAMVLRFLIEHYPERMLSCMQAAYGRSSSLAHQASWYTYLFSFSSMLGHAETHATEERGAFVKTYMQNYLLFLHTRSEEYARNHPSGVFTITHPEEAKCCYIMLRHMIRSNDPSQLDSIRFLLDIPSVKQLAHHADVAHAGGENALLRLALSVGNTIATRILLNITEVRQLAERNRYYQAEQRGEMNLEAMARNHESAMVMLTSGEEKRLANALAHYQPLMREVSVDALMGELKARLEKLYAAHPAVVEAKGERMTLPLSYSAFQILKLSPVVRNAALKSYYRNKFHTAIRYLSKPNLWMSQAASFVCINESQTQQRWSRFEENKPLIALFYLASVDAAMVGEEKGFDPDARFMQYVDELAHIGRAHNWDRSRPKLDDHDKLMRDDSGAVIQEEYDDLEGDKPSCLSGVKRRLFQSVPNHPLLRIMTSETITSEVHQFVREHYAKCIRAGKKVEITKNWDLFLAEVDEKYTKRLHQFDLTSADKKCFFYRMHKKYKGQLDQDLLQQMDDAFSLRTSGVKYNSHFEKFYSAAHLDHLLAMDPIAELAPIDALQQTLQDQLFQYQDKAEKRFAGRGLFHRQVASRRIEMQAVLDKADEAGASCEKLQKIIKTAADTVHRQHRSAGFFKRFTRSGLELALRHTLNKAGALLDNHRCAR